MTASTHKKLRQLCTWVSGVADCVGLVGEGAQTWSAALGQVEGAEL